jgi:hypothetical protein
MDRHDGEADIVDEDTMIDQAREADKRTDPGDSALDSLGYDVGGTSGVGSGGGGSDGSSTTLEKIKQVAPLFIVVVFLVLFALMWLW